MLFGYGQAIAITTLPESTGVADLHFCNTLHTSKCVFVILE